MKVTVGLPCIGLAYHIRDRNGFDVIYSDTGIESCHITNLSMGEIVTMDWEFAVCLQEGNYTVAAMLSIPQDLSMGNVDACDFVPLAANFQVNAVIVFRFMALHIGRTRYRNADK